VGFVRLHLTEQGLAAILTTMMGRDHKEVITQLQPLVVDIRCKELTKLVRTRAPQFSIPAVQAKDITSTDQAQNLQPCLISLTWILEQYKESLVKLQEMELVLATSDLNE